MPDDRRSFITHTAGALAAFALLPERSFVVPWQSGSPRKTAVIGVGRQGRAILDELRKIDAVEVSALCDVLPARLTAALEKAPGAETFADCGEMLTNRTDIEAVIVATPTHLHRGPAIAALQAGRHVYCEAPLAASIEDCRAIGEAAARVTTVFQSGLYARANPIYQRARMLVRSDSVRDVVSMYGQHHRKTSWRFPSGAAANWRLDPNVSIGLAGEEGTHLFDLMAWLRNKPPVRAAGHGTIRLHEDGRTIADTIWLQLTWDDGVAMQYRASLANSYGGTFAVIDGTNGSLRLAGTHGWMFKEADAATQGWEVYATRQSFFNEEGIVLIADATRLAEQGRLEEGAGLEHPPLYYSLAAFVDSVVNGSPVVCTAADGMRATAIGIQANQAVVTGKVVEIDAQ